MGLPVFVLPALRLGVWTGLALNLLTLSGLAPGLPTVPWWVLIVAGLLVVTVPGRCCSPPRRPGCCCAA